MNRISRVALILCACFVSVAWGQQPVGKCYNRWAQFHKYDMQRWNRCEKVLGVNNVGNLALKWGYTDGDQLISSPAVADGMVYVGSDYPGQNIYAGTPRPGPGCGATRPALVFFIPRPQWPMGWCISARGTTSCTR